MELLLPFASTGGISSRAAQSGAPLLASYEEGKTDSLIVFVGAIDASVGVVQVSLHPSPALGIFNLWRHMRDLVFAVPLYVSSSLQCPWLRRSSTPHPIPGHAVAAEDAEFQLDDPLPVGRRYRGVLHGARLVGPCVPRGPRAFTLARECCAGGSARALARRAWRGTAPERLASCSPRKQSRGCSSCTPCRLHRRPLLYTVSTLRRAPPAVSRRGRHSARGEVADWAISTLRNHAAICSCICCLHVAVAQCAQLG